MIYWAALLFPVGIGICPGGQLPWEKYVQNKLKKNKNFFDKRKIGVIIGLA